MHEFFFLNFKLDCTPQFQFKHKRLIDFKGHKISYDEVNAMGFDPIPIPRGLIIPWEWIRNTTLAYEIPNHPFLGD